MREVPGFHISGHILYEKCSTEAVFDPLMQNTMIVTGIHVFALNQWGELASLFNPPVLVLKTRHSVLFIFPDGVFYLFIFPFSKQTSYLSLFIIWDVTGGPGAGGGWGAAWFGAAFTFLIFYKLFNYFNIWMEALLALARPYGQTRTEELSSWRFLTEGRPIWSPLF